MEDDAFDVVTNYTNSNELVSKEEYKVEGGKHNVCKAIRDLMSDSRAEGRAEGSKQTLLITTKNLFRNGATYELVRASIKELSDEELRSIYEEVCA